jgi:hypothetical protein
MRTSLLCSLFLFALPVAVLGETQPAPSPHSNAPMEFDSFFVVLLVRPPDAPELPKAKLDQLQEQHLGNIRRLYAEGKVFKAGPMEDHSSRNVRGMFILKTSSLEEAQSWVATDPAVRAGRLVPEFMKWYVQKGSLK